MIRKLFLVFSLLKIVSLWANGQSNKLNLGIIPAPNQIHLKEGFFQVGPRTVLSYRSVGSKRIALLFARLVKEQSGIVLPLSNTQADRNCIVFDDRYVVGTREAYQIEITATKIWLKGRDAGLFYALQSLSQVYLANLKTGRLPQVSIKDQPRYAYRGLLLDAGRHYYSTAFIKKVIDAMAVYKLNNFHWHLTDDQGWRIEIKKYPKLTQTGAYRDQTMIGNLNDSYPARYDGKRYGGYYTQQQAREIVAYAASKYITVIPEIEMPGHSTAALASYPELGCGDNAGPFKVAEKWGVQYEIYCAGKERTFHFLENVLTEIVGIFPSKYIHIGGDEAMKDRWKTCMYCQKRIKDEALKDEHGLQSYFISRMERFLNQKGRSIIGYDEILEGGLAPRATVMSWQGTQGGIAAARQKHDVIMMPLTDGMYLDFVQGRSDQEPLTIAGGDGRIEKAYAYDPTPKELLPELQKYIVGVQGALWGEYMPTTAKVEYMLFPRLMAVSEVAWTLPNRKDYRDFNEARLPLHLGYLDKKSVLYRVPNPIGAKDTTINVSGAYRFQWALPVKGSQIYYTIDGRTPDATTGLYADGLIVDVPQGEIREVKSVVIAPSGKRSSVLTTLLVNRKPFDAVAPTTPPKNGRLKYYYVPGKFQKATEVDTAKATAAGLTDTLKIPTKVIDGLNFGLVYTGYIYLAETAEYEFSLASDDGSRLYIDDTLVIDNDGEHYAWERAGAVVLKQGYHKILLSYFNVMRHSTLDLTIKIGGKKMRITPSMLSH